MENPNPDMGKIPSGEVPKLKIEPLQRQFETEIIPQPQNTDLDSIHILLKNILENQEKIMKKLKI